MITKEYVNNLAYKIVGCAIKVHNHLGPGLLESIYEEAMEYELVEADLPYKRQTPVSIKYKTKILGTPLKLDLLVGDLIVVELKAVEAIPPVYKAQTLTYMKLIEKPKGLLINFNCVNLTREGLIPLVNEFFVQLPGNPLSESLVQPKCL